MSEPVTLRTNNPAVSRGGQASSPKKLSPDNKPLRVTVGELTFVKKANGEIYLLIGGKEFKVSGKLKQWIDRWMRLSGAEDQNITREELERAARVIANFAENKGYSLEEAFNQYNDPSAVMYEADQKAETEARLAITDKLSRQGKKFSSSEDLSRALKAYKSIPAAVAAEVVRKAGVAPTALFVAQLIMRQTEKYPLQTIRNWFSAIDRPLPPSREPSRAIEPRQPVLSPVPPQPLVTHQPRLKKDVQPASPEKKRPEKNDLAKVKQLLKEAEKIAYRMLENYDKFLKEIKNPVPARPPVAPAPLKAPARTPTPAVRPKPPFSIGKAYSPPAPRSVEPPTQPPMPDVPKKPEPKPRPAPSSESNFRGLDALSMDRSFGMPASGRNSDGRELAMKQDVSSRTITSSATGAGTNPRKPVTVERINSGPSSSQPVAEYALVKYHGKINDWLNAEIRSIVSERMAEYKRAYPGATGTFKVVIKIIREPSGLKFDISVDGPIDLIKSDSQSRVQNLLNNKTKALKDQLKAPATYTFNSGPIIFN